MAIIDLGTRATSGVVTAGAVLTGCAGISPLMIALTAKGLQSNGARPPSIFNHVLPKPLELRAFMTVIARRDELARH